MAMNQPCFGGEAEWPTADWRSLPYNATVMPPPIPPAEFTTTSDGRTFPSPAFIAPSNDGDWASTTTTLPVLDQRNLYRATANVDHTQPPVPPPAFTTTSDGRTFPSPAFVAPSNDGDWSSRTPLPVFEQRNLHRATANVDHTQPPVPPPAFTTTSDGRTFPSPAFVAPSNDGDWSSRTTLPVLEQRNLDRATANVDHAQPQQLRWPQPRENPHIEGRWTAPPAFAAPMDRARNALPQARAHAGQANRHPRRRQTDAVPNRSEPDPAKGKRRARAAPGERAAESATYAAAGSNGRNEPGENPRKRPRQEKRVLPLRPANGRQLQPEGSERPSKNRSISERGPSFSNRNASVMPTISSDATSCSVGAGGAVKREGNGVRARSVPRVKLKSCLKRNDRNPSSVNDDLPNSSNRGGSRNREDMVPTPAGNRNDGGNNGGGGKKPASCSGKLVGNDHGERQAWIGRASQRSLAGEASNPVATAHRSNNDQTRVKAVESRGEEEDGPSKAKGSRAREPTNLSDTSGKPAGKSELEKDAMHAKKDGIRTASEERSGQSIIDLTGQSTIDLTADPGKTHVIFAIDFSSSMRKRDVRTANGKTSRWNAVFQCIDTFLTQQLQKQQPRQSGTMSTCLVSVFIFNKSSQVILERAPLIGDGNEIFQALTRTRKKLQPKGGTGFSAGFREAERLARSSGDDKVVLVFLSDGRPGDLRPRPPHDPSARMQATSKHKGVVFPSAGHYIETMKKRHTHFNLQLICLYNEGVHWLKYLASHYGGTFHNPDLMLDDVTAYAKPCPLGQITNENGIDTEEDEVIEVMKVKSQATLIRERCQQARAAGEIVSLTNMSTTNLSSIRSTFSSISATVTAMRSAPNLQERAVTIKQESAMISYQATRMLFRADPNGVDKFVVAPGESANGRTIRVSVNPFAQGGLRNVYHMKQQSEKRQVAKESRHGIKYNERLKFHLETVKCQEKASDYAHLFNKGIKRVKKKKRSQKERRVPLADMEQPCQQPHPISGVPQICVLNAEVYRLKAPSCPGGFRYLAVEKCLEGSYEKWNNNDGFVNQSNCIKCEVAQAFSHFTYEKSDQQIMVVDIQGSADSKKCVYTDPQLHSTEKKFGRADRGTQGFAKFFKTHQCNFICQELRLPQRSDF